MKISFLFIVSMSLGVAHAARVRSGLVAEDNLVAQAETRDAHSPRMLAGGSSIKGLEPLSKGSKSKTPITWFEPHQNWSMSMPPSKGSKSKGSKGSKGSRGKSPESKAGGTSFAASQTYNAANSSAPSARQLASATLLLVLATLL